MSLICLQKLPSFSVHRAVLAPSLHLQGTCFFCALSLLCSLSPLLGQSLPTCKSCFRPGSQEAVGSPLTRTVSGFLVHCDLYVTVWNLVSLYVLNCFSVSLISLCWTASGSEIFMALMLPVVSAHTNQLYFLINKITNHLQFAYLANEWKVETILTVHKILFFSF